MGINIKYGPPATLLGDVAYRGGLGRYRQQQEAQAAQRAMRAAEMAQRERMQIRGLQARDASEGRRGAQSNAQRQQYYQQQMLRDYFAAGQRGKLAQNAAAARDAEIQQAHDWEMEQAAQQQQIDLEEQEEAAFEKRLAEGLKPGGGLYYPTEVLQEMNTLQKGIRDAPNDPNMDEQQAEDYIRGAEERLEHLRRNPNQSTPTPQSEREVELREWLGDSYDANKHIPWQKDEATGNYEVPKGWKDPKELEQNRRDEYEVERKTRQKDRNKEIWRLMQIEEDEFTYGPPDKDGKRETTGTKKTRKYPTKEAAAAALDKSGHLQPMNTWDEHTKIKTQTQDEPLTGGNGEGGLDPDAVAGLDEEMVPALTPDELDSVLRAVRPSDVPESVKSPFAQPGEGPGEQALPSKVAQAEATLQRFKGKDVSLLTPQERQKMVEAIAVIKAHGDADAAE